MKVEQIYTGCLAQGAYYIESDGEAAIIDPLRDPKPYIDKAAAKGSKIKFIFETHFHADFVSGHLELAGKTGATIVYGPGATTDYAIHQAKDGEEFEVGRLKIKALHTPGHTLESTTYLLLDEEGNEHAIFSGDTLFIGDVGRPDLSQKGDLTQDDLAAMLFKSLRTRIMTLPDEIVVYPAHGAGSACGKNMSKETSDLLGNQKKTNYALRADMTQEEFIKEVTDGLLPPPRYFAENVAMNKSGAPDLDTVLHRGNVPLDPATFEQIANEQNALVLDTRSAQDFAKGHIPNSIFIGIDGGFAPWVGALIPDLEQAIIFLCSPGREEEVITRLSRVGYDNTLGFLEGGVDAWTSSQRALETVTSLTAENFAEKFNKVNDLKILDVRKPGEFYLGHVEDALSFPLDFINDNMEDLDADEHYFIHCAGGYRSMIAASILKSRGFHQLVDVAGGFKSISETKIPLASQKVEVS
ncbi:MAG: MBL fold metallo-hydrolase [Bacteroidota bacterium]